MHRPARARSSTRKLLLQRLAFAPAPQPARAMLPCVRGRGRAAAGDPAASENALARLVTCGIEPGPCALPGARAVRRRARTGMDPAASGAAPGRSAKLWQARADRPDPASSQRSARSCTDLRGRCSPAPVDSPVMRRNCSRCCSIHAPIQSDRRASSIQSWMSASAHRTCRVQGTALAPARAALRCCTAKLRVARVARRRSPRPALPREATLRALSQKSARRRHGAGLGRA